MCGGGGGPSGPSAADLAMQEREARARAQAETDRINAERMAAKEAEQAKILADQATAAEADVSRRARNRTLLAGVAAQLPDGEQLTPGIAVPAVPVIPSELDLEEPTVGVGPRAARKARNARTLIGAY